MSLRDAYADLVLGSSCLGCGAAGRMLCVRCAAGLPDSAREVRPRPCPPGLARTTAAAPYDGLVKAMVIGLKERQLIALARPLGDLLALAAARIVPASDASVVLVPVPSRASSVRARGFDSTRALAERAATRLRREGVVSDVEVAPLLRTRPGLHDQAGLDAKQRAENLAGALTCPAPALRRLARHRRGRRPVALVLCDDVVTTGATAREAQRALAAVGLPIAGVAAVAATQRYRNLDGRRDFLLFPGDGH